MKADYQSNESLLYNRLFSALAGEILDFTSSLSKDRIAGLRYALSTLEEDEQSVLLLRYQEKKTLQEISVGMGRSEEEVCALEKEALRKLRQPGRWDFIRHGVSGNLRRKLTKEHRKAYRSGFYAGYQKGLSEQNPAPLPNHILNLPIEVLGLSSRAQNCLARTRITTVGEAAECTEESITRMRNLGVKTAAEIAVSLRRCGIKNTHWDRFLPDEE